MEVVFQTARVESAMGWENVWMLNQVSVGCAAAAYAKSSWAKTKPGTAIEPVMVTSPRKASSGAGADGKQSRILCNQEDMKEGETDFHQQNKCLNEAERRSNYLWKSGIILLKNEVW
jgi:hypothetical protein